MFLSAGLTETCMYIPSISAVMGCFRSGNCVIAPSRLHSKSGPLRSMSFRQDRLNLDLALETRRSFFSLFELIDHFQVKSILSKDTLSQAMWRRFSFARMN